jgi:hypothetical protein
LQATVAVADLRKAELVLVPGCPAPGESIEVNAYSLRGIAAIANPTSITVAGASIEIVAGISPGVSESVPSPLLMQAAIGPLNAGTYTVKLVGHESSPSGQAVRLIASKQFEVKGNSDACTPAKIVLESKPFLKTLPNGIFGPTSARVVDASNRPVAGVPVFFWHVDVGDSGAPGPWRSDGLPRKDQPVARFDYRRTVTGINGLVGTNARANAIPGTTQYMAYYRYAGKIVKTYFVLSARPSPIEAYAVTPVVEYFHSGLNHYFMTVDVNEMAALDAGVHAGWERTGGVFLAYPATGGIVPPTARDVCRFYGRPEAGLDSHFFSVDAAECSRVQSQFATSWQLETLRAFLMELPNLITGQCPPLTQAVRRYFNQRPDANHRYVIEGPANEQMLASDSIAEGYGPDAVVMCAPL